MLIEVDKITYKRYFPVDPHPFISEQFIELNKGKVDKIIRLIDDCKKPVIGLVAGIRNGLLLSPFSAPFGGFHFHNEIIYISEVDSFLSSLKAYIEFEGFKGIDLTLPPDLYNLTFNTKTINSLIRCGFRLKTPEITNWVNLQRFEGEFSQKNSRKYYKQAVNNGLTFNITSDEAEKKEVYALISRNRARFNRPIYMTFKDLMDTGNLWPIDFFRVNTNDHTLAASAIFYRFPTEICYGVFWGDSEICRPLRAMDFLAYNLWVHYKNQGFNYMDLGISTESGKPNEGLLRFKESHDAISSLRFSCLWQSNSE
jgi:hypothetical protein